MVKLALRAQHLKTLTCPPLERKVVYRDTTCRGLQLEVRATGGRTWYLTCSTPRGHRQQLRLGNGRDLSLAQARSLANRMRAERLLAPAGEPRAVPTLQAFVEQQFLPYLQWHKPSWQGDEAMLRLHILPLLGSVRLDALQRRHVQELLQRQLEAGLQANTANKAAVLLRHLINCAMAWEVMPLQRNPVGHGSLLKSGNQRQRLLSPSEARRLLEAVDASANPYLGALVRLLLLTGARKREALDARWDAIDWERSQWLIPHSKSGQPRTITLSRAALQVLKQHQQVSMPSIWVFTNPATLRPYRRVYCAWDTARRRAGLAELRMHDCRHSFASFVINAGLSLYEVQQLLGHSSSAMTQRYAHLNAGTLQQAATEAARVLEPVIDQRSEMEEPAGKPCQRMTQDL